jgi:hypothetical protein
VDKDRKDKSNLRTDKDLKNTETNPVTRVRTDEPRSDREDAGRASNRTANNRNDKSKTPSGGSKEQSRSVADKRTPRMAYGYLERS